MASHRYEPGQRIEGSVYRVVRHLATGGMGSVYDVEDVSVGKRYVLKTLNPELVGREDLARRMDAEARILVTLQHPNIVEVVTAGTTQDQWRLPYYVMEKLNGQNLRTILEKKGILDTTVACQITIDLLDALEHAHDHGVIHRDVKPENIFLHRSRNGTTTTKLLDFGIMRLMDGGKRETQGRFVGTLRYAAPEQILGAPDLGPAVDLYAAGLVLYELLGGRGPFDDLDGATKIGHAHASAKPPPLSLFAPGIPPGLHALVMSALAKEPSLRPRDAFSFAAELRRLSRPAEAVGIDAATAVNPLSVVPPTRADGDGVAVDGDTTTVTGFDPIAGDGGTLRDEIPGGQQASQRSDGSIAFARTLASGANEAAAPRPGVDRGAATRSQAVPAPRSDRGYGTERYDAPVGGRAPAQAGPSSADIIFPPAAVVSSTTGSVSAEVPPSRSGGFSAFLGALVGVVVVGAGLAAGVVAATRPRQASAPTASTVTGETALPVLSASAALATPMPPPASVQGPPGPPPGSPSMNTPVATAAPSLAVGGATHKPVPGRQAPLAALPTARSASPPGPPTSAPAVPPTPATASPAAPTAPASSPGLPRHFQVD